jgi:hypothetical protein
VDKIQVDFGIQSLDSSQQFQTTGMYHRNKITFTDEEQDKHEIIIKNNIVEYRKQGSVDLYFVFDPKKLTKGTYTVYQHHFEFAVFTEFLDIGAYDIKVQYKLLQEKELVNEATLTLHYEFI